MAQKGIVLNIDNHSFVYSWKLDKQVGKEL